MAELQHSSSKYWSGNLRRVLDFLDWSKQLLLRFPLHHLPLSFSISYFYYASNCAILNCLCLDKFCPLLHKWQELPVSLSQYKLKSMWLLGFFFLPVHFFSNFIKIKNNICYIFKSSHIFQARERCGSCCKGGR